MTPAPAPRPAVASTQRWWLVVGAAGLAIGVGVVLLASGRPVSTARCPPGLHAEGPRCCAAGQRHEGGACRGTPTACPPGFEAHAGGDGLVAGCAVQPRRVRVGPVQATLHPAGWEVAGAAPVPLDVAALDVDAFEVTWSVWRACSVADTTGAVSGATVTAAPPGADAREPGLPATGMTLDAARACCRARGGRLPTGAEFLAVAAGAAARRFPWGPSGLVCRRAAFGLVEGACAEGGRHPDLAGARPDGATPEGVHDLSGNVAEWTSEPGGGGAARGGSFRSRSAAELTSWAATPLDAPRDDVGFRCVFAVTP